MKARLVFPGKMEDSKSIPYGYRPVMYSPAENQKRESIYRPLLIRTFIPAVLWLKLCLRVEAYG
jgi:hypothetical protein